MAVDADTVEVSEPTLNYDKQADRTVDALSDRATVEIGHESKSLLILGSA